MFMKKYAMLAHPGLNRVYAGCAAAMCVNELRASADSDGIRLISAEQAEIAGVGYVVFECEDGLSPEQLRSAARLSAFFALFEMLPGGLLLPVGIRDVFDFPDDITTLLKYSGKTNEQFTHLMVNLARCACRSGGDGRLKLIDPLCGKGSTLFAAMRFGMDAAGIEIRPSWVQECCTFLSKYLETGRCKHRIEKEKRTDSKGRKTADVTDFSYALNKEAYKDGDLRRVRLICADTLCAGELLPRRRFDLLVTDLPYGVQHGSRQRDGGPGDRKGAGLERSAVGLVDKALDGWLRALKPGAAIVMAYNTLTTPGDALAETLIRHGTEILSEKGYTGYAHRVDRSISRDIIAARRL